MKFSCSIILLFSILLVTDNAFSKDKQNMLEDSDTLKTFKKYSLQYQVDDLIKFSSFQGSLISFKYHMSDKNSFMIGVSVGSDFQSQSKEEFKTFNDSTTRNDEIQSSSNTISLSCYYLFHFMNNSDFKLYLGFGPSIAYGRQKSDLSNNKGLGDTEYKRINEMISWSFFFNGIYGIEYFINPSISLLLENRIYLSYIYRYGSTMHEFFNNPENSEKFEDKTSSIRLNTFTIKFGISVYLGT